MPKKLIADLYAANLENLDVKEVEPTDNTPNELSTPATGTTEEPTI